MKKVTSLKTLVKEIIKEYKVKGRISEGLQVKGDEEEVGRQLKNKGWKIRELGWGEEIKVVSPSGEDIRFGGMLSDYINDNIPDDENSDSEAWVLGFLSNNDKIGKTVTEAGSPDVKLFEPTKEGVSDFSEKVRSELQSQAPIVNTSTGFLNKFNYLFIKVILEPKDKWPNGIIENAKSFTMHLDINGVLELTRSHLYEKSKRPNMVYDSIPIKFRKTRVKNEKEVIYKISKFISDIKNYYKSIGTPLVEKVINEKVPEIGTDSEPQVIKDLRDVVNNGYRSVKDPKTGEKKKVDSWSASAIVQLYDQLPDTHKEKYAKLSLLKMQSIALHHVK